MEYLALEGTPDLLQLKQIVSAPIPGELIRQKKSGKDTLSYMTGSTYIDLLNQATGYLWEWEVKDHKVIDCVPKPIKDKDGKVTSMQNQNPVAHVLGKLSVWIPVKGGFVKLSKDGFGSQPLVGGQSEQENMFKGADTDAQKNAAKKFGFGLELFRNQDEQGYFEAVAAEDGEAVEVWTDEMMETHKEQLTFIKQVRESNELDDEAMSELVKQFSGGALETTAEIVPDNIVQFCEWLKAGMEGEPN